jgi:hypothetical protein
MVDTEVIKAFLAQTITDTAMSTDTDIRMLLATAKTSKR